MNADLKIGIGSIVPHPMSEFDGGAKIVSPSVASIETIVPQKAQDSGVADSGFGIIEDNGLLPIFRRRARCRGCMSR